MAFFFFFSSSGAKEEKKEEKEEKIAAITSSSPSDNNRPVKIKRTKSDEKITTEKTADGDSKKRKGFARSLSEVFVGKKMEKGGGGGGGGSPKPSDSPSQSHDDGMIPLFFIYY